jgi:hypothetical protein
MNNPTNSTEHTRTAMIAEALALLHIIDSEQGHEDINESPQAREARLLLQAKARQLVVTMIAELQAPIREPTPTAQCAAAA